MLLLFKEISEEKKGVFCDFAKDFFRDLGFQILLEGASEEEFLMTEEVEAQFGKTKVKWLVSCLHKAASGKALEKEDVGDMVAKMRAKQADGFLGFYSSSVSSELEEEFRLLGRDVNLLFFDADKIQKTMIEKKMFVLAERYFPASFAMANGKSALSIAADAEPLECQCCHKNLLTEKTLKRGILSFVASADEGCGTCVVQDFVWLCKGNCEAEVEAEMDERREEALLWYDLEELYDAESFIEWQSSILADLRGGTLIFTDEAFQKLQDFMATLQGALMAK